MSKLRNEQQENSSSRICLKKVFTTGKHEYLGNFLIFLIRKNVVTSDTKRHIFTKFHEHWII